MSWESSVTDPAIAAATKLVVAMGTYAAALTTTGRLPEGPDFDAADELQDRSRAELDAALRAFADTKPTTPLGFHVHLDAFVALIDHEYHRRAIIITGDDGQSVEPPHEPSLNTIVRMLAAAFEDIFERGKPRRL